jgi:uncharacterized protein (DUF1015 family)
MPVIAPFRGIRYNRQIVADLNKVITQPYDKINSEAQARYYASGDHNFVRLILNREPDPYEASRKTCEGWLADGTLLRDPQPCIYPYRQVFTINGRRRIRRGLTCLCKLEPLEGGRILPHERTLSKPKEDRLNLMRATRKQFEHVFMLYSDPEDRVNELLTPIWKWTPEIDVTDEYGTRHCLWSVSDAPTIRTIQNLLRPGAFVIADGHHRYETALTYRDEMRRKLPNPTGREAFNYRLVTCVNLNDPALVILPTHRLVRGLGELDFNDLLARTQRYFTVTKLASDAVGHTLSSPVRRRGQDGHFFVAYLGKDRAYAFVLKSPADIAPLFPPERSTDYRGLDVAVLHTAVIENLLGIRPEKIEDHVSYERDWQKALTAVDKGAAQLAFLVQPTRPEQVQRIAEKWERMPQKSTDFYPKLVSGLVFLDVDEHELTT